MLIICIKTSHREFHELSNVPPECVKRDHAVASALSQRRKCINGGTLLCIVCSTLGWQQVAFESALRGAVLRSLRCSASSGVAGLALNRSQGFVSLGGLSVRPLAE